MDDALSKARNAFTTSASAERVQCELPHNAQKLGACHCQPPAALIAGTTEPLPSLWRRPVTKSPGPSGLSIGPLQNRVGGPLPTRIIPPSFAGHFDGHEALLGASLYMRCHEAPKVHDCIHVFNVIGISCFLIFVCACLALPASRGHPLDRISPSPVDAAVGILDHIILRNVRATSAVVGDDLRDITIMLLVLLARDSGRVPDILDLRGVLDVDAGVRRWWVGGRGWWRWWWWWGGPGIA